MIKKFLGSEFGKGAIILFVMMNFANLLNFIFHFLMGRMLGPVHYGTLAVLMSLMYIYSIPVESIQNLISRYVTRFNLNKEHGKIKFLIVKSLKKGFIFSLTIFAILIPISFFISKFLDINFWLIIVTNIFIFSAFSIPITKGTLQGRKKFSLFGGSLVIESFIKISVGVFLVVLGMQVFGAIVGVLVSAFIGILISIYFNWDLFKHKKEEVKFREIYTQSIPYFITTIVILLVFSLDIILAKRFFSAETAGKYAVLSMLGKMIFFATMSISKAMFPLTSEKCDNGEDSKKLFRKSILMISLICVGVVLAFAIFPKLIILILYGSQYVDMAQYLVYSGIAFSFLALNNLILIYGLSINKLKKSGFLFVFLLIEIILLSVFHDNILEYILAFMFSNIVMFIGSLFLVKK
ncbi:MAG: oligosaccharide flippase family protein [Nanoarchaeota archaeon]